MMKKNCKLSADTTYGIDGKKAKSHYLKPALTEMTMETGCILAGSYGASLEEQNETDWGTAPAKRNDSMDEEEDDMY
jgi:hypothetical protein